MHRHFVNNVATSGSFHNAKNFMLCENGSVSLIISGGFFLLHIK